MGSTEFCVKIRGENLPEAFIKAVKAARREFGHDGYTGTIAEKEAVKEVPSPEGLSGSDLVSWCFQEAGESDKWAPAQAVQIEPGVWLCFGRAPE